MSNRLGNSRIINVYKRLKRINEFYFTTDKPEDKNQFEGGKYWGICFLIFGDCRSFE